ncbi:hypothetical protein D2962_16495 [Biomaibacter acetigenes]|uniref:PKD domain-containing protein n=1 Tax=Biomaibacter acetigenes TaxID=2316383 RepID=A0A3G2R941_9FIRM|nr:hypothetical protein [Biomaibacter acetigenes]AYO31981.1 hypothetical protein D2962_16495 [Biomaibacter acetigenes]
MTKKITALALAIMMILAFSATAMAAPTGSTVISNELGGTITVQEAPTVSTYKFEVSKPETIVAHLDNKIEMTLTYNTMGSTGYNNVLVTVDITKPDGAEVDLLATDTNGQVFDIADLGYWGPPTGFPIAADYSATTDITARFSMAGTYTITTKLVDKNNGDAVITEHSETVDVVEPISLNYTTQLPTTVKKGSNFDVTIKATNNYKNLDNTQATIERSLYIMELTKDNNPATSADVTIKASDGQALGYNDTEKYFFWGPSNGFPFSTADASTTFTVTFNNAGTYSVKIYAVQLPLP